MRRRLLHLRTLPLLLVVVVIAGVGCKYRVAPTAGISTSAYFAGHPPGEQELELARLAQIGAHWVRLDLEWDVVQADGPNAWNWQSFDTQVQLAEAQGLEVLAVAIWTPGWANNGRGRTAPPDDALTFARFLAAAAGRYQSGGTVGARVRAWEIWNEPNNPPFWAGAPDAAAYVTLLRAAYLGVKVADPNAIVVSGGLAPNGDLNQDPGNGQHPVNYLNAMYSAGASGFFDAFGHHPYAPVPFSPLTDGPGTIGWNSFAYTLTLHEVMAAHGDGFKQIWGTETGPPTGSCAGCVSEATQRQWLAEEYLRWRSWPFVGPLLWHSGRDGETGSADPDQNFGLLRSDFMPKPAFDFASALW